LATPVHVSVCIDAVSVDPFVGKVTVGAPVGAIRLTLKLRVAYAPHAPSVNALPPHALTPSRYVPFGSVSKVEVDPFPASDPANTANPLPASHSCRPYPVAPPTAFQLNGTPASPSTCPAPGAVITGDPRNAVPASTFAVTARVALPRLFVATSV